MTGQRLLAEMVHGYGITHVFLVPTILTPALAAMGEFGITRVTAHSEKAAAYMADGYARATRKPGVCMAQTVGAANLAAGLKDARLAGSPVIALSGGSTPTTRYRHAYQELTEDFEMFAPVTKFSARVERVDRLPDLFRQAIRAATSGAPGPAHLEIAGEQGFAANDEADFELIVEPRFAQAPAFRPAAEPDDIRAALERLARADRPVLAVGGGVTTSVAQAELLAFAERHGIPFVTSLNGKSGFADAHPLNVGVLGTYSRTCANKLVAEADLVFFVGSHAGGQVTANWRVPTPRTAVIQLDIDPLELGRNYPNDVSLLGDARTVLRQLIEASSRSADAAGRAAWQARVSELKAEWRTEVEPFATSDATPMRPERVCQELTQALPDDAVVVVDTGHSGMWTGQMLGLRDPRQMYLRAAGSLGWSFPAALGVKSALPNRPVLCFTGDGGFYYHAMELETAARYGINAVVLVNNNFSLNQDERPYRAAYGGEQHEGFEMWQFSKDTDFARLAESLGCMGMVVERPAELKPALERAFAANRPVVLDVRTDIHAMAPLAWTGAPDTPRRTGAGY
ncbi:MAG TPA: thiamine pyrophosphate-binding protein [Chloroflexota bacterium]